MEAKKLVVDDFFLETLGSSLSGSVNSILTVGGSGAACSCEGNGSRIRVVSGERESCEEYEMDVFVAPTTESLSAPPNRGDCSEAISSQRRLH